MIVGLTIALILLGGFLLLGRMRFAAPGLPDITFTLPMPYGDASLSLQDLLSYLFQMRSFTFTLTLLILVIITRLVLTIALRRR